MDSKKKITISWSGGKDSALALFRLQQSKQFEIVHLHTVIDQATKRVGLHGVRETLIESQAEALGLKLVKLFLPPSQDHDAYVKLMTDFYQECAHEQISAVMFGDIFLDDLKTFRESMLSKANLEGVFPLWKQASRKLIEEFLAAGFKTVLCAADKKYFNSQHIGSTLDKQFIDEFSQIIDICGENGEFHTFVYDGPTFKKPVDFSLGSVASKEYRYKMTNADGLVEEKHTSFLFQELF
jgi:uncharacterized protein (TIGR00290 family)